MGRYALLPLYLKEPSEYMVYNFWLTRCLNWSVAIAQAVLEMFWGENCLRVLCACSARAVRHAVEGATFSVANAQQKLACRTREQSHLKAVAHGQLFQKQVLVRNRVL